MKLFQKASYSPFAAIIRAFDATCMRNVRDSRIYTTWRHGTKMLCHIYLTGNTSDAYSFLLKLTLLSLLTTVVPSF